MATPTHERRRHSRVAVQTHVWIDYEHVPNHTLAVIRDLAESSAFMETNSTFDVG